MPAWDLRAPKVGEQATDLDLLDESGRPVHLSALARRSPILVLVFGGLDDAAGIRLLRDYRDTMLPVLRAQGFEPETPRATMYLWVPLPEGLPSATFQRRALQEEGVVTVPGSGFGAGGEGFVRIALTVATPRLVEAAERLGKVLAAV